MDEPFIYGAMLHAAEMAVKLSRYGFTECSTLRHFLLSICGGHPDYCELLYIRGMLRTCLNRHDDGSPWFADLRAMERQTSLAMKAGPTSSVRTALLNKSNFY